MIRLVASFFGAGLTPVAPGTAASFAALLVGAALMQLGPLALPAAAALACIAGFVVIPLAVPNRDDDPGWVVIDEAAGQWLAMTTLGVATPAGLLAAFVLFRVLDILKPGPIGWADRRHGAFGIMVDDLIAGVLVATILWLLQVARPGVLG